MLHTADQCSTGLVAYVSSFRPPTGTAQTLNLAECLCIWQVPASALRAALEKTDKCPLGNVDLAQSQLCPQLGPVRLIEPGAVKLPLRADAQSNAFDRDPGAQQ